MPRLADDTENCPKDAALLTFGAVWGSGDMSGFLSEWKRDLLNQRTAAMWGFATLIAGMSGPLGSYENCTFDHRLMLWGMWIGLFAVIGTGVRAFVHHVLHLRDFHRGGLLTAVLVACGVGFPVNAMNFIGVLPDVQGPYLNADLPEIAAMVFVLSLAIVAHHHFWRHGVIKPISAGQVVVTSPLPIAERQSQGDVAAVPRPEAEALPRIVMRLEPALRGPLVALSVRDHYVDVQTLAGRGSLLMRLGDAMEEVGSVAGAQMHRSHWVAWDRVRGVERSGDRIALVMAAGPQIPVSRTNRPRLVERGLI